MSYITESQKAKTLRKAFKNSESDILAYEIYEGIDRTARIALYIILDDDFKTTIKLDELGIPSEELITNLEKIGYVQVRKENKLIKKAA